MSLDIYVNTGNNDVPLLDSSGEFELIDPNNDTLIFSGASDVVDDGETIPSESELIQAGIVLDGSQKIIDRYFLSDISEDELKEIFLMGNTNTRYIMAFDFDDETASEPILELWDDTNLNTVDDITLGAGVPTASYWRGIVTTDDLPGASWATDGGTTRLAGASDGHYLLLNNGNGALPAAGTLYCNLAIVVPASATQSGSFNPVFAVKWLES